jgi:cyclopropane-fatty-acyl-phospholipid synthase
LALRGAEAQTSAIAERKKRAHNHTMLYKFKSKATGDLIMLEPQGRQILKIIGKEPGAKGIIEPHQMLAAIEALQQAVVKEEEARQAAEREAQAAAEQAANNAVAGVAVEPTKSGAHTGSDKAAISLKQRVVPFIDMLRRAHAEDKDIVWGV